MAITKTNALKACVKGWKEVVNLEELKGRGEIEDTIELKLLTSLKKHGSSHCPCCEFVDENYDEYKPCFELCPLSKYWPAFETNCEPECHNKCENLGSPYQQFEDSNTKKDARKYARQMVKLAEKALVDLSKKGKSK